MADVTIQPAQKADKDAPSTSGKRGVKDTKAYIYDEKNNGKKILVVNGEKIQGALNLLSEDQKEQLEEILRRHGKYGGKAKKLCEHIVISYKGGKPPDDYAKKDFEKDIKIFLKKMGMSDHAVMYAVHCDTDNIHIHVLVDRVSPYPNTSGRFYIPLDTGVCTLTENNRIRRNAPLCMQAAMSAICLKNGWDAGNSRVDENGKSTGKCRQGVKSQPPHTSSKKIDLISDVQKIFSDAEDWTDAIQQLTAHNIKYEVAYDKSGKPRGSKFSRNGVYGKSSELSRPNQFFSIVKVWGNHPDAPPLAPKQLAYDALHQSLRKSVNLKELQKNVKNCGCILKVSGSGFRIFVNGVEDSFKPSQLGTTSKKIEQIFENNKLFREAWIKKKKHRDRERLKRKSAYLQRCKKRRKLLANHRTKSKARAFFKIIFGLLFAKKYQPRLPQALDQKQWHSYEQIRFNLGINDSDMKPPFVLLVTENGFTYEKKFEDINALCDFVILYSEQNPHADFRLHQITLEQRIKDLHEALTYLNVAVNDITNINSSYNLIWNNYNLNMGALL